MDPVKKQSPHSKIKKSIHRNEKKEKDLPETTDGASQQINMLVENDSGGSASSTGSEDLANTINYNTITSLAALKDIIQGDGDNTPETDSFFQHYFMNHCNNLSSRSSSTNSPFPFSERRRLSQCPEEDEDDHMHRLPPFKESASQTNSQTSTSESNEYITKEVQDEFVTTEDSEALGHGSEDSNKKGKRMVIGARHKFVVTSAEPRADITHSHRAHHNAHTVHFGTRGAEEQRPSIRNIFPAQNLRHDKTFFDSSLIEIRSIVDGLPNPLEDIWVKRPDDNKVNTAHEANSRSKVSKAKTEFSSVKGKIEIERARSSTWGEQVARPKEILKKAQTIREHKARKGSEDRRHKRDQRVDGAITRSTLSVEERKRRSSVDDSQADLLYQQTIHGTSGVSRRPALLNIFKLKQRSDAKKHPSIMQQVKAAVQSMTKSTAPDRDTPPKAEPRKTDPRPSTPVSSPAVKARDGSAHPHSGSDTRYYHTVTAAATRRPSAMAKVMDIFRGRASAPGAPLTPDAAERRKADLVDSLNAEFVHAAGQCGAPAANRSQSLAILAAGAAACDASLRLRPFTLHEVEHILHAHIAAQDTTDVYDLSANLIKFVAWCN